MKQLPDITDRSSIEQMVRSFYDRATKDDLLGPIFNDIAKVDWDHHLPIMFNFWESILLGGQSYQGRPFPKHVPLPIDQRHFERWVSLFEKNIDEQYSGPVANDAKMRAHSIARIFQSKLALIKK